MSIAREQPLKLIFDHPEALTAALLQAGPVQQADAATVIANQPGILQLTRHFRDAASAHTKQVGDQLLSHQQAIARQALEILQQPVAELLIQ